MVHTFLADHTLMGNQLLAAALRRHGSFSVVGSAESAEEVLATPRNGAEVIVISESIRGKHSSGFHLVRSFRTAHPDLGIIVLLDRPRQDLVVESFCAGANGVFCRTEPLEVLCNCIQSVHEGKTWVGNDELKFVIGALVGENEPHGTVGGPASRLTPQEWKVVSLVAEGLTNRQIAEELNLSQHTIKNYLLRMYEKLGVSTRVELVFTALGRNDAERSRPIPPEKTDDLRGDDNSLFESYFRAAEHLSPFSQLKLGELHLEGRGAAKDFVSAYVWFALSEETAKRISEVSQEFRQLLQSRMTAAQIAEAGRRASEWLTQHQEGFKTLGPAFARKNGHRPDKP